MRDVKPCVFRGIVKDEVNRLVGYLKVSDLVGDPLFCRTLDVARVRHEGRVARVIRHGHFGIVRVRVVSNRHTLFIPAYILSAVDISLSSSK